MATERETSRPPGVVYVVDDDDEVRALLARVVAVGGWTARPCASGAELLRSLGPERPACIVLDVSLPGSTGLEIQRELAGRGVDFPILFLTGLGTVQVAVEALRGGAFDFLEKPTDTRVLVQRIEAALAEDAARAELSEIRRRFASLTGREHEICELLAAGLSSKQIAAKLSLSARTVEHHRERILRKTGATNAAELARLHVLAGHRAGGAR